MLQPSQGRTPPTDRRSFLQQGALLIAAPALVHAAAESPPDESGPQPVLRIGLVTDLHYADRDPGGSRHYRDTLRKFAEAAAQFEQDQVAFLVELGDVIDAADSVQAEQEYLRAIARRFAASPGQAAEPPPIRNSRTGQETSRDHSQRAADCCRQHYVLGNHCVWSLSKPEFLEIVSQPRSYYSFDQGGYHFVVLDACFRSDGTPYGRKNFEWTDANLPAAELDWLQTDLKKTPHKTIVFIHQRLDVDDHYGVKNAAEVRRILEQSGRVLAVFQGHYHRHARREIAGIAYCTLAAMVEGAFPKNAYAVLEILPGDQLRLRGFGHQPSYPVGGRE
jgi:alkaline phosphatase